MAALPYIQLYAADYLADTVHLTLQEHGAYLLLILNYWQRGTPPADESLRLAAICRCSILEWEKLEPALSEFFDIRDGFWYHNRIEEDLLRVAKQHNQRIAAGTASANARKRKINSTVVERPLERPFNGRSTNTDTDTDTELKESKPKKKIFRPPTVDEVQKYCTERQNSIDPQEFIDHYEANGWFRGKTKIKDWKACIRTWEKNRGAHQQSTGRDNRSRAKRVSDTLDEIARKANERDLDSGAV